MRSRNVVLDISISNHPGCSTRPERAKSRVPVEDRSPKAANASPRILGEVWRTGHGIRSVDGRQQRQIAALVVHLPAAKRDGIMILAPPDPVVEHPPQK